MTLLCDIVAGILLGMCYDILKAFRKKIRRPIVNILSDLLFWIQSLLICIWLFLLTGDKQFRFYELFGAGAGFWCYFLTISDYFVKISEKIADFFLFFLKILFTIIKFFAIIVKNGVLFLYRPLKHLMQFGKKGVSSGLAKWKRNVKLMKRI